MQTEQQPGLAERLTRRQWYDEPSTADLFSDGSSCRGSIGLSSPAADPRLMEACLEVDHVLKSSNRKVSYNPPAGTMRKKDLHGLWLKPMLALQENDNQKARAVLQQKRELNLAKQTVAGLRVLGLNYDVTELSIIFRLAYKHCEHRTSKEAQAPEVARALSTLDAALRFDLKKVATNLGLVIKRPKTFGA